MLRLCKPYKNASSQTRLFDDLVKYNIYIAEYLSGLAVGLCTQDSLPFCAQYLPSRSSLSLLPSYVMVSTRLKLSAEGQKAIWLLETLFSFTHGELDWLRPGMNETKVRYAKQICLVSSHQNHLDEERACGVCDTGARNTEE